MRLVAVLLAALLGVGCRADRAYVHPPASDPLAHRRLILARAAQLPWMDEGRCAVKEASGEWRALVERCYHALDLSRLRFQDIEHRCSVADADAASVQAMVGVCLLIQPELIVGAVVVIGVIVIAAALAAELNQPPRSRCEEVAVTCRESCTESSLPTKSGTGFEFWRCVNACLERNGCAPGMY
jgi:hypothetical protein